jgi:hypothetical protein
MGHDYAIIEESYRPVSAPSHAVKRRARLPGGVGSA